MYRAIALFLALACGAAAAQNYPSKPVKLIVTYPPGGSSDLMARVFGAKLSEVWAQTVITENKPGAAGSIGMDYAAKQPADGYSFVVGNIGPAAVNPILSKVPYDMERDFAAISLLATGPNVLIVNPGVPAKSLRELIDLAKLLGRRTYEDFYAVWPKRTDSSNTEVLNTTQKYVASTTLSEPLPWSNSTLLKGDAIEAVARLKKELDKDLVVLGSRELVQSLMQHHLIDEYVLLIHPLVLGSGCRLFPEENAFAALRLVDVKTTPTGVVVATYQSAE